MMKYMLTGFLCHDEVHVNRVFYVMMKSMLTGFSMSCPLRVWGSKLPDIAEMKAPLVGAQGYHRFPFSKPVVGQSIALHAVPAYGASILVLPGSFNFLSVI